MASNYEENLIDSACGWYDRGKYDKAIEVFLDGMDRYPDTRKKLGSKSKARRELEGNLFSANALARAMRKITK